MQNRIVTFFIITVLTFSMCTTAAFAGVNEHSNQVTNLTENTEIVISSTNTQEKTDINDDYYIKSHGIDEYESIILDGIDYWYENLPIYYGKVQDTVIDAQVLESFDNINQTKAIGISIASIHIDRVSKENDPHFDYWRDADLTEPVSIYNLDETLYGYAYGVVDNSNKLVGYMITGVNKNAPPISEYSYDPARFLLLERAPKVYFSSETGLWIQEFESLKSVTGTGTASLNELSLLETTPRAVAFNEERTVMVQAQWDQCCIYAGMAQILDGDASSIERNIETIPELNNEPEAIIEEDNELEFIPEENSEPDAISDVVDIENEEILNVENEPTVLMKAESDPETIENNVKIQTDANDGSNIGDPPGTQSAVAATDILIPNTADHTWLTICSYTTMSMYLDAIGRRIEPALMGTERPHSIKLNKSLHSVFGHSPSASTIASSILAWANSKKLTSNITFYNYFVYDTNTNSWNKHKNQIALNIPTMVGYSYNDGYKKYGHIMMGIGYNTNNYYIVRDTWTNNGKPMNSTFLYNLYAHNYYVIGLNYNISDAANTGWGYPVLRQGDSNFNVKRLKIMLYLLYYDPGSLTTNTFDAATTSAVKAFQQSNGLVADGIVGSATYSKLRVAHIMCFDGNSSNWRVLMNGSLGDDVAQLQIRLYCMGILNDTCDGIYGSNTIFAVKKYQQLKGLTIDGVAGVNTFAKLYGTTDTYTRSYLPCTTCIPPQ